jgi:predicted esterase YcpF (UPF0227 family)
VLKILFLHGLESKPGGSKAERLMEEGHTVYNPTLPKSDFAESVRIAQEIIDSHSPDVIVGSSRGGAVAMAIQSRTARLVLVAPAWKNYNVDPSGAIGSKILHCAEDIIVPIEDSRQLEAAGAALEVCGKCHRMTSQDVLDSLASIVNNG